MAKLVQAVTRSGPRRIVGLTSHRHRGALHDVVAPWLASVLGLARNLVIAVFCCMRAVFGLFSRLRSLIASPGIGIGMFTPTLDLDGLVYMSQCAAQELPNALNVGGARPGDITNRGSVGTIALGRREQWVAKFSGDSLDAMGELPGDTPAPDLLASLVLRNRGP